MSLVTVARAKLEMSTKSHHLAAFQTLPINHNCLALFHTFPSSASDKPLSGVNNTRNTKCYNSRSRYFGLGRHDNLLALTNKSSRSSPKISELGIQNSSFHSVSKIGSYPKAFHGAKKRLLQKTRFEIETGSVVNDARFEDGKPTWQYAQTMPKTFASMTNEQVLNFAMLDVPEACRECVIRDIMGVDKISYDEALQVFNKIAKANREDMFTKSLPFRFGIGVSLTAGFCSIPLVFHEETVVWFNQNYVWADLPPAKDLETWLEVGTASWTWMEPVLGQISFFLLCMQFARAQLQNLGIRPYFNWQREHRAAKLCERFPQYNPDLLQMYSKCDELAEPHVMSD